jgi:hypothetical protein
MQRMAERKSAHDRADSSSCPRGFPASVDAHAPRSLLGLGSVAPSYEAALARQKHHILLFDHISILLPPLNLRAEKISQLIAIRSDPFATCITNEFGKCPYQAVFLAAWADAGG